MKNKKVKHICQRCLEQWTFDDICDDCCYKIEYAHLMSPEFHKKYIFKEVRNYSDGIARRISVDFYSHNN
jgi:predicted amidophosphoribosyltransferase